jgi:hypothetical protein
VAGKHLSSITSIMLGCVGAPGGVIFCDLTFFLENELGEGFKWLVDFCLKNVLASSPLATEQRCAAGVLTCTVRGCVRVHGVSAGLVASGAVMIEKKSRRAELAMYTAPRAIDSLLLTLTHRKWVPSLRFGESVCLSVCLPGSVRLVMSVLSVCHLARGFADSPIRGFAAAALLLRQECIAETNRIRLVLFGMQNRTFGPYAAAINRILISLMVGAVRAIRWGFHGFVCRPSMKPVGFNRPIWQAEKDIWTLFG